MNAKDLQIHPGGVPLSEAWYSFANRNLRAAAQANYEALDPSSQVTALEALGNLSRNISERSRVEAAIRTAIESLRKQLANGQLQATGLLPPITGRFQRTNIEPEFWDVAQMDVRAGSASAMGVEYTAVKVHRAQRRQKTQLDPPIAATDFPATPGATSYENIRAEAILHCFQTYANFDQMKLERKLARIADYVSKRYPDFDTSRGFDRSSYYATTAKLRKSGQIASKNVQK